MRGENLLSEGIGRCGRWSGEGRCCNEGRRGGEGVKLDECV